MAKLIEEVWRIYPEWRLGQLIALAADRTDAPPDERDALQIGDDLLERALEEMRLARLTN
ncbi:MAG TPA: hypothetical protein VM734_29930 [Kofleriaceae bacterium]|jgi:hypothetical protein|nr:hypothetical protein [Kofleriaceae bacterium]